MFTGYRNVLQCLYPSTAAYPNIFQSHEASHTEFQWQMIFILHYALQCIVLTHYMWSHFYTCITQSEVLRCGLIFWKSYIHDKANCATV